MSDDDPATVRQERLSELRGSAKGWHGVQLAALGFIGLCGVLQTGESSDPMALQVLAGILVLVAFVLACIGIYLVGRAAWPIYGADLAPAGDADQAEIERASGELRRGLVMTFASIAVVALATTASWWPTDAQQDSGQVQVEAAGGESFCGQLAQSSQTGTLRVLTDTQPVEIALQRLTSVRPVDSC
jgi:hypothetical protein